VLHVVLHILDFELQIACGTVEQLFGAFLRLIKVMQQVRERA
jgi:hypothetical protein